MGDYFQAQVNYTEGALRYIFFNSGFNWYQQSGGSAALGILSDGVYGGSGAARHTRATATGISLTTGWNVNAAYEHFWSPRWRTSLYGGYAEVSYGSAANAMLCGQLGFGSTAVWLVLVRPRSLRPAATPTGTPGGSVRAPSGISPRTSTWAWT